MEYMIYVEEEYTATHGRNA